MTMLSRDEIEAIASSLRAFIAAMQSGKLTASTATRYRLEGALAALEAVLGIRPSLLDGLTGEPDTAT